MIRELQGVLRRFGGTECPTDLVRWYEVCRLIVGLRRCIIPPVPPRRPSLASVIPIFALRAPEHGHEPLPYARRVEQPLVFEYGRQPCTLLNRHTSRRGHATKRKRKPLVLERQPDANEGINERTILRCGEHGCPRTTVDGGAGRRYHAQERPAAAPEHLEIVADPYLYVPEDARGESATAQPERSRLAMTFNGRFNHATGAQSGRVGLSSGVSGRVVWLRTDLHVPYSLAALFCFRWIFSATLARFPIRSRM